jgi:hypothetical protein
MLGRMASNVVWPYELSPLSVSRARRWARKLDNGRAVFPVARHGRPGPLAWHGSRPSLMRRALPRREGDRNRGVCGYRFRASDLADAYIAATRGLFPGNITKRFPKYV